MLTTVAASGFKINNCRKFRNMELQLASYKNRHPLWNKLLRALWMLIWGVLFRPTPRGRLFRFWRIFLLKCFGAKVCWSSNVLPSCRIWQPWKLTMGEHSCLSERVDCYNVGEIVLGNQVTISQDTFLCTASHDISSPIMELTTAPLYFDNYCWVCARCIILPGVHIGTGAVIAAGSVVSRDVAAWNVVGGNPAIFLKIRKIG